MENLLSFYFILNSIIKINMLLEYKLSMLRDRNVYVGDGVCTI